MAERRPFRFGLLAGPAPDARAWREQARQAEDLGYSTLLVPDHLGQEWGPLTSLAVAAESTESIGLGTLMLAVDLRLPVVLHKELATLNQFAPGRLEIGVGAGWFGPDYERAGIPMGPARLRIERLEEAVTILKGLWRDPRFSHSGTHYTVTGAVGEPCPSGSAVRWVLGGGGRRMLEVAVRHADVVSLSAQMSSGSKDSRFGLSATCERFDERVAWVHELAGERLPELELQCLVFAAAVTADSRRYGELVLAKMFGLPAPVARASPLALVGSVGEICDQLHRHRDRYGISYWVLPASSLTSFRDVVERMSGT